MLDTRRAHPTLTTTNPQYIAAINAGAPAPLAQALLDRRRGDITVTIQDDIVTIALTGQHTGDITTAWAACVNAYIAARNATVASTIYALPDGVASLAWVRDGQTITVRSTSHRRLRRFASLTGLAALPFTPAASIASHLALTGVAVLTIPGSSSPGTNGYIDLPPPRPKVMVTSPAVPGPTATDNTNPAVVVRRERADLPAPKPVPKLRGLPLQPSPSPESESPQHPDVPEQPPTPSPRPTGPGTPPEETPKLFAPPDDGQDTPTPAPEPSPGQPSEPPAEPRG